MCNNIRMNELKIQRKETKVSKDKISDWIEDRAFNVLRNKNAIEKRMTINDGVRYISGYPLKLNNGTKVRTIRKEKIDEKFEKIIIEFLPVGEYKTSKISIKRYLEDSLDDIQRFLINSQSIAQTRNIDLNYD